MRLTIICLGLLGALTANVGGAAELSAHDQLMVSGGGSITGNAGNRITFLPDRPDHVARLSEDARDQDTDAPGGGVVQLPGPFGIVVDVSSGVPRMRGLSVSATDYMRIEARGRFALNPGSIGAEISVHFNF